MGTHHHDILIAITSRRRRLLPARIVFARCASVWRVINRALVRNAASHPPLVCLGAVVFTMLSYSFNGGQGDPSRVAAQVVTGTAF